MARDLGGNAESSDRKDDWQRIESERADRDRSSRQHDAKHDPDLLFELHGRRPEEHPHRENRRCPPEVAAEFGRTPEQIEALKEAERQRKAARAAESKDDWTEQFIREQIERGRAGISDRASTSDRPGDVTDERRELLPDDRGTLIAVEGRRVLEIPLAQTDDGPVQRIGGREALGIPAGSPSDTHLEAHAAALMRARGTKYAELYVNREPCPGRSGCENLLPTMLAPRTTLLVRSEDGLFSQMFVGRAEGKET